MRQVSRLLLESSRTGCETLVQAFTRIFIYLLTDTEIKRGHWPEHGRRRRGLWHRAEPISILSL